MSRGALQDEYRADLLPCGTISLSPKYRATTRIGRSRNGIALTSLMFGAVLRQFIGIVAAVIVDLTDPADPDDAAATAIMRPYMKVPAVLAFVHAHELPVGTIDGPDMIGFTACLPRPVQCQGQGLVPIKIDYVQVMNIVGDSNDEATRHEGGHDENASPKLHRGSRTCPVFTRWHGGVVVTRVTI